MEQDASPVTPASLPPLSLEPPADAAPAEPASEGGRGTTLIGRINSAVFDKDQNPTPQARPPA